MHVPNNSDLKTINTFIFKFKEKALYSATPPLSPFLSTRLFTKFPSPRSLYKDSTSDSPGALTPTLLSSIILCQDLNNLLSTPLLPSWAHEIFKMKLKILYSMKFFSSFPVVAAARNCRGMF